jgi:hypothetical protein
VLIKKAKITRRLRNFVLPRIQLATGISSKDCMSLHTQRTVSSAIASFPIPSKDPHAFLKCIAVNNGLYFLVIRTVIKIGEKLKGS